MSKTLLHLLNEDLLAILLVFGKNELVGLDKSLVTPSPDFNIINRIDSLISAGYIKLDADKIYYRKDLYDILNCICNNEYFIAFTFHTQTNSLTLYGCKKLYVLVETSNSLNISKLTIYENKDSVVKDLNNKIDYNSECPIDSIKYLQSYLTNKGLSTTVSVELTSNTKLLSFIKHEYQSETQYLYFKAINNYIYEFNEGLESITEINKLDDYLYSLLS